MEARLEGFESLKDLDKYVGKYVDLDFGGDGASGWVERIGPEEVGTFANEHNTIKSLGRNVILDYGYGFFVTIEGVSIKEVEPPPGDQGIFKPEEV